MWFHLYCDYKLNILTINISSGVYRFLQMGGGAYLLKILLRVGEGVDVEGRGLVAEVLFALKYLVKLY